MPKKKPIEQTLQMALPGCKLCGDTYEEHKPFVFPDKSKGYKCSCGCTESPK